jgi:aminopeptidase N
VWLSERFATYFTLLCTEHNEGRDAFVAGLRASRETVLKLEPKMPGLTVIHDNLSDMRKVLNQIIYQKGAWTLHMLRCQIETDAFWAGIQDYDGRYRNSNASTDDFRHVMEEHGHADLKWFFDQWLKRPGSPQIEGTWTYDARSKKISVDVTQLQSGEPYRLRLELGIHTSDAAAARIETVRFDEKHRVFEIPSGETPSAVVLDPNTQVLISVQFTRK